MTLVRDLIELLKPSILFLSVFMAALGMWLVPESIPVWNVVITLAGTGLIVGSANALNMVLERETDAYMTRTRKRPLPDGRMNVVTAAAFGIGLGGVGTALIYLGSNFVTAGLGFFALTSYVCWYTPLKRKTPQALAVGAVPGAMPALMGWTAVTGTIDLHGLAFFAVLLLWQFPHFIAIAIYRQHDYAAAGIKVVPVVRGVDNAKWQTLVYATTLVPITIALFPLGAVGWIYGAGSLAVSVWFLSHCIRGFQTQAPAKWARRVFLASLVYLPALSVFLVVDTLIL